MRSARTARLVFLRYQVRALKKRERMLQALLEKRCDGLHADAQADLERTRRHLAGAEEALQAQLASGSAPHPE